MPCDQNLFGRYLEESAAGFLKLAVQYSRVEGPNEVLLAVHRLDSSKFATSRYLKNSKQRFLGNAWTLNENTLVQHALRSGADPSIADIGFGQNCSTLHLAFVHQDLMLTKRLLQAGATVRFKSNYRCPALNYAFTCATDPKNLVAIDRQVSALGETS